MNIYSFIEKYRENNPKGHFFDEDTLKFFGERKSEMRVFKNTEKVIKCGELHTCYVVSTLQRKAPGGPKRRLAYFDNVTFKEIQL